MIGISSLVVGGTIDKAIQMSSAAALSQDLTVAAFGGFALESLLARMEMTPLQKNIKQKDDGSHECRTQR
jgi:hypothetical protein